MNNVTTQYRNLTVAKRGRSCRLYPPLYILGQPTPVNVVFGATIHADDGAVKAFVEAAKALSVPLTVIRDDVAGKRARYEAALLLVRPDQFVAWTSNDGEVDADAILKRVTGLG